MESVRTVCQCPLCKKGCFLMSTTCKMKGTAVCVLILKSLMYLKPEKSSYSMKEDIYDFIQHHWVYLREISMFKKSNWKKLVLDTFNHCTSIETGKVCGQRASFRLKRMITSPCPSVITTSSCQSFNQSNVQVSQVSEEIKGIMNELSQELKQQNVLLNRLVKMDRTNEQFYSRLLEYNAVHESSVNCFI